MTSTGELERLVRPSDMRAHRRRPQHSGRRRGWFGAVADAVVAAIAAVLH